MVKNVFVHFEYFIALEKGSGFGAIGLVGVTLVGVTFGMFRIALGVMVMDGV